MTIRSKWKTRSFKLNRPKQELLVFWRTIHEITFVYLSSWYIIGDWFHFFHSVHSVSFWNLSRHSHLIQCLQSITKSLLAASAATLYPEIFWKHLELTMHLMWVTTLSLGNFFLIFINYSKAEFSHVPLYKQKTRRSWEPLQIQTIRSIFHNADFSFTVKICLNWP